MITLLILSILPVIILLVYIYRKDKYEKEPFGLLMKAFGMGVLLVPIIIALLTPFTRIQFENEFSNILYSSFALAAIPEEGFKFCFLYWLIWRNKEFNEYFDGIVYAVFISLGFACVENILYVMEGGIGVGIVRAIYSVPGHFLFAVIMGYYFSMAKFSPRPNMELIKGLCGAILAHGMFNFMLYLSQLNEDLVLFIWTPFTGFDILLWQFALKKIKSHAQKHLCEICNKSFDGDNTACPDCGNLENEPNI